MRWGAWGISQRFWVVGEIPSTRRKSGLCVLDLVLLVHVLDILHSIEKDNVKKFNVTFFILQCLHTFFQK